MATRKLEVIIAGDSRSLERSFSSASRSIKGFNLGVGSLVKSAAVIGGVTAAVGGVAAAVRAGVGEFSDATKVAAQTAAAIKSTGGVANVTAKQVDKLATAIMNYSGIDDEAIKSGENLLLTFKNVRNEIGKGNDVFNRASKAAVDLSVAGFGSIETTAKQLGKALNDPVRGMTALGRAGVTFSDAQKKTIKALVDTGHTLEAQKLILKEVESQVGGSAKAFGQTLPGQLSRLKESFKNTLGDIVGQVAPAVSGALGQFNDFLNDLGRARTVGAKIRVTLDRIEGLAVALTRRIGDAIAAIDWNQIWKRARGVADGLQRRLEQVDFSAVGRRIGDAFSDAAKVALPAAKDLAERISRAIDAIDWEKVGRSMGPGLASAVATAFVTLTDPAFWARNWDLALSIALVAFGGSIGKIAGRLGGEVVIVVSRALGRISPAIGEAFRGLALQAARAFGVIARLIGVALGPIERLVRRTFGRIGRLAVFTVKVLGVQAAINAVVNFGRTVGRAFGDLGRTIGGAFSSAFDFVVKKAIQAALAIVEPFSHIPRKLGGGVFQDLKKSLKAQLDGMAHDAQDTSSKVNTALASIKDRTVTLGVNVEVNGKPAGDVNRSAGVPAPDAAKSITGALTGALNFFQGAIDKANKAAKTASDNAAKAAKQRAAAAKRAAAAAKKAAEEQRNAFDGLVGSLGLQIDKDLAAHNFAKALKDNSELQKQIRAQIKIEGNTTELATQLFQAQQARAEIISRQSQAAADARAKAAAKLQASQFKALGLTAEGDARTPGVPNLKKQLAQITDRLGSDVSPKIAAQLAAIGKVLSGSVGKVTLETRKKILELFQTIRSTLTDESKKGSAGTQGFVKSGFKDFISGVEGLTSSQIKQLRSAFVQTGPGGTRPTPGFGAFGLAFSRPSSVAVGGGGFTVNVNGDVVTPNPDAFLREMQRRAGVSAATRTGVRPGINRGLG